MKFILPTLCTALALIGLPAPSWAEGLRAGAATSNITPDLGSKIVGNYVIPVATNVHDELHARCLVVSQGDTTLAFVVCDLISISASVSKEARAQIESRLGIPQENVLISCTHTHSAASARADRYNRDTPLDEYQRFVAKRIADGVQRAHGLLRPAEVAFGSVEAPEHVFNRRWIMKEGTAPPNPFGKVEKVRMNPPRASENLVEPAGPTDPTVSFVAFREPGGRLISLLAAYSLHYVGGVRSHEISADYYGVFCEHLKSLVEGPPTPADAPFVALMANGTSGDINNINFREKAQPRKPYEQLTFVGQDIAKKVHGALEGLEWKAEASLDARYTEIPLDPKPLSDELVQWAKETLETVKPEEGKVNLSLHYADRVMRLANMDRSPIPVPIQHLRIGDIGIGAFPAEVFAETGLEFKERSPLKHPFLISLAHDSLAYLPPPRHFELGGYETWPGANWLEPLASVKMMDVVLKLAAESMPGPAN